MLMLKNKPNFNQVRFIYRHVVCKAIAALKRYAGLSLLFLSIASVSTGVFSQTIDEFSKMIKPLLGLPSSTSTSQPSTVSTPELPKPTPGPNENVALPVASRALQTNIALIGIFSSSNKMEAEFEVNNMIRHLKVGDALPGNWRIEKISESSVRLKWCDQENNCENKTLIVGAQ